MSMINGKLGIFNSESCPNCLKFWHTEPPTVNMVAHKVEHACLKYLPCFISRDV